MLNERQQQLGTMQAQLKIKWEKLSIENDKYMVG